MKNLRNRVSLIGRLGKNPEVKEINGKTFARVSLATTESYKSVSGERVFDTQWHNLVAWGNTALIFQKYLKKGKEIAIDGRIVNRAYEDKTGNKRYISEIVVNDILMLGSKSA
ncbi:MAG: single-stranded DNA-binding protein [Marinilabiliales bacterium]